MKQVVITFEAENRDMETVVTQLLVKHMFEVVQNANGEIRAYSSTELPTGRPVKLEIPDFLKSRR